MNQKDYPKEIILKDGTGVTFRPLRKGDETPLFEMFKELSDDDRWFTDGDVSDFRVIDQWLKRMDQERMTILVAVLEGRIIASATLILNEESARGHIGRVSVTVVPSFRTKNLGTWLLFDLMNLAISVGLEILVMELIEDRDASGIRGAKRLDFFQEALLKDYVKDRQGNYHSLVIMVKRLYLGWKYKGGLTKDNPALID